MSEVDGATGEMGQHQSFERGQPDGDVVHKIKVTDTKVTQFEDTLAIITQQLDSFRWVETVADPGGGKDVPLGLISFIFMQFWQIFLPPTTKSFCSRGGGGVVSVQGGLPRTVKCGRCTSYWNAFLCQIIGWRSWEILYPYWEWNYHFVEKESFFSSDLSIWQMINQDSSI